MAGATRSNPWALLLMVLSFGAMWVSGEGAHHVGAPAPTSVDCSSAILSLADCLTFVEEGSKVKKPEGNCCSGLKKVVKEEVSCLCQAFKGSADFGVSLNITKALTLPSACGVHTPPFSKCNIAVGGAPGAAPALSPGASPSASPSVSISAVPAPSPVHSIASYLQLPSLALLATAAVLVLSYQL